MAMLARGECGITKKHPEARVDCAMAHALQCTIETGGSIHRTVGAVAMVRSRQTDMPVREVDAQYVDSVASVVSIVHLPDRVCSRGFGGEGGAHRGQCERLIQLESAHLKVLEFHALVTVTSWSTAFIESSVGESHDPGHMPLSTVDHIQSAALVRNGLSVHVESMGIPLNIAPQIIPRDEIQQQEIHNPAHLGRRHTIEGRLQVHIGTRARHVA